MDGEQDVLDVELGDAGSTGGGETDVDLGESTTHEEIQVDDQQVDDQQQQDDSRGNREPEKEEEGIAEFRGLVNARLKGIVKKSPELGQVFKKYPDLLDQMEAVFRREAALREVFPTVAEARFMRDQFPNGQADVQALLQDVGELEAIDKSFDAPGEDGTYPGHLELIDNFWDRDGKAAVALMRRIPREWAKRDAESYNDVMGKIIAATFQRQGIPDFIADLAEAAADTEFAKDVKKLQNWVNGFFVEKPKPSEEEQRIASERQKLEKDRSTASRASATAFHATFVESSKKIQRQAIMAYPAIRRIEKLNTISKEKLNDIVEKIRANTVSFLSKSPSFMRKLRPAHEAKNLQECEALQRAAWSQPWLLNRMVRSVLAKEVPQLVQQNRDAIRRRGGEQRPPARKSGEQQRDNKPKGNYKDISGQWRRPDGSRFSTAEVLAGKHLTS